MTAQVVDIHDFLSTATPAHHDDPCPVVTLPTIRVERCPTDRTETDEAFPCDSEPSS
ncbi:MAG: hypothetical protein KGL39_30835 [Patescibacteria group bacterium]|nr:hypothetical protein [Patescibacteria group bacterium]